MVNKNHCLVRGTPADNDYMNHTITPNQCDGDSGYISTVEGTPDDVVYSKKNTSDKRVHMENKTHCLVGGTPADNEFMNHTNTEPLLSNESSDISNNEGTPVCKYHTPDKLSKHNALGKKVFWVILLPMILLKE
jgi:hypothetical protein